MKLDTALRVAVPAHRTVQDRPLSFFEFWPDWAFYLPVVAHWLALGVRYGGFTLPTAANPTITTGGVCGESKIEILDQVTGPARDLLHDPRIRDAYLGGAGKPGAGDATG